jgi:hypothetical protein
MGSVRCWCQWSEACHRYLVKGAEVFAGARMDGAVARGHRRGVRGRGVTAKSLHDQAFGILGQGNYLWCADAAPLALAVRPCFDARGSGPVEPPWPLDNDTVAAGQVDEPRIRTGRLSDVQWLDVQQSSDKLSNAGRLRRLQVLALICHHHRLP